MKKISELLKRLLGLFRIGASKREEETKEPGWVLSKPLGINGTVSRKEIYEDPLDRKFPPLMELKDNDQTKGNS